MNFKGNCVATHYETSKALGSVFHQTFGGKNENSGAGTSARSSGHGSPKEETPFVLNPYFWLLKSTYFTNGKPQGLTPEQQYHLMLKMSKEEKNHA